MRLRHIEVFHAVMQAGTISGAAQLLYISQPAVTKVLQHCELQLGLPLFDRIKGKLYPTPEARKLFVEVDRLNRDLQSVRRMASSLKDKPEQTVRMVSTPTLAMSVVPTALTSWRGKYPEVRCKLSTHHTPEIVSALLLGEADFALSLHDPKNPSIGVESLAVGSMSVIAPAGTWSAKLAGTPLHVSELPPNLIGLASDDPLGNQVVNAADAFGTLLDPHTVVQTYQLARTLVENRVGTAVIDPFTAAQIDKTKAQCRVLSPHIAVELFLLTANSSPLSQSARHLVKCIRNEATRCLQA
ncbi:MAG: transcriptional regulator [Burkholderiales bacterium PBB4]|nr:MAG: transcriptional regulator [Burkholderiales bacterium PBB4]